MRLHWMVHRLRAMSVPEIGFRLRRRLQSSIERAGLGLARPRTPHGVSGRAWVQPLPRAISPAPYVQAAERILGGHFDVFALHGAALGFPPRWNVDPLTGTEAPLLYGKDLDYRDRARVGDNKYLWEINRQAELVRLAQAWHLSREERFAEGCRALLDSWLTECPYPRGMSWCVSLEAAVRLANWCFAWQLLGGEGSVLFQGQAGRGLRERWLGSIYQHCHFIAGHFSRHSSANNHLLGEATGLLLGALTWPLWRESERWRARAHAELAREALAQNTPDGVNREQALWYHQAVAEMMLIAGLVSRANGHEFSAAYWQRLEAMLEFVLAVRDAGGHVPAIGDADEGILVRLAPEHYPDVYGSLLASGAVLFGRPDFARAAAELDDKTRWLFGDEAERCFPALIERAVARAPARTLRRAFPQGGYFVLGEALGTAREVRIVADAAPLGYLSIAAHGHADALAFTLSAAGRPLLIDAGNYAYCAPRQWRSYFRGTAAHNTARVDGQDQSIYRGSFLWDRHARTTLESAALESDPQRLSASHDGYLRLSDPVRHRRTWCYYPGSRALLVRDAFQCARAHRIELHWHFAPECRVQARGAQLTAEREGVRLRLAGPPELSLDLVHGRESPPLGWHSPAYDVKVPTSTAVLAGEIHGSTVFETRLDVEFVCDRGHTEQPAELSVCDPRRNPH